MTLAFNTTSLVIADVESSITRAYELGLGTSDQEALRHHLAFVLGRLREPNSQIEPAIRALKRLEDGIELDVQRSVRRATWAAAVAAGAAAIAAAMPFFVAAAACHK